MSILESVFYKMNIFKKFLSYYKPYQLLFWTDMFCALVVSAVDLSFPLILSYLTKSFFTKSTALIINSLALIGALLVFMYIIKYFCQYFITSWGHIMGARMESDMRRDLFYHLQKLSFSYYDQNNTGEMMSKITADLFDISELAHHGPEILVISILKIVGSFVILTFINAKMTILLLAITGIMVIYSTIENKKMTSTFYDNRVKIAGVNSSVQDSLSGIRVVKSFANEDIEKKKFDNSNNEFLKSKSASYHIMGSFSAGASFFEGLLYVAVIVSGGYFIAHGSLNIADLAVYILYINIYINPLDTIINFTEQFQKGYAGFKRFLEVINTIPKIRDRKDAHALQNVHGEIEYNDVTFRYNDEENVLEHINIKIHAGEKVALVGPSGGGKTTLCSLLPRFYDVTDGRVLIDGQDIRNLTQDSLRNAIGVVQQDVYMFEGSIRENIAYGLPDATDEQVMQAAKDANIHDYILTMPQGYDTFVGERGVRLSGGQKQRISIARVFLKNPPILILDEATSALDNESERYIQKSLDRLTQNRTAIVIAHRLSTIQGADEIIVIDESGIKERGNHSELLKLGGTYARYFNMQFDGLDSKPVFNT